MRHLGIRRQSLGVTVRHCLLMDPFTRAWRQGLKDQEPSYQHPLGACCPGRSQTHGSSGRVLLSGPCLPWVTDRDAVTILGKYLGSLPPRLGGGEELMTLTKPLMSLGLGSPNLEDN